MDLQQRKLNRSEWETIEIPVSKQEITILKMIMEGYHNVNIRINNTHSIFTFIKIEYSEKMEDYLYNKYLRSQVEEIEKELMTVDTSYKPLKIANDVKINSADKIRLEKNNENTMKTANLYEFLLLVHLNKCIHYKVVGNTTKFTFHYFTIYKLIKNNIEKLNRHIINFTNIIIKKYEEDVDLSIVIENAVDFIEKNQSLLKYDDLTLYEHQKEIFTVCKDKKPKLVLYMAPTGTGKTLTPIALSEINRVIFVCAARHVGLALAKAAISSNKKVAFAFGCSSADDIRLHYYSAKEYSLNKRSGGIGKVDNSVGDKVEIMICDIRSYMYAMYYMLAFNEKEKIIMYWDEPTITLDYKEHEFHAIIQQNWKENLIPNVVLSSATLPKLNELTEPINDFKMRFGNAQIYNIVSHDCKKSIPIINKDGFVVVPHYLSNDYNEIKQIARHCEEHLTLSRYFDLKEIVDFISYLHKMKYTNNKMSFIRHFETLGDVTMKSIKVYYIKLLQNIKQENWPSIFLYLKTVRKLKILSNDTIDPKGNKITKTQSIGPGVTNQVTKENINNKLSGTPLTRLVSEQVVPCVAEPTGNAGVYFTTKDAYTLTDGPTIFISNDVEKIGKFCIQQANIPSIVMEDIMKKITYNNSLNEKLEELEKNLEYIKEKAEKSISSKAPASSSRQKQSKDLKKINRESGEEISNKGELNKLGNEINMIRSMIKVATLNETFVPNKPHHLKKWAEDIDTKTAFTSNIDEHIVSEIMALHGIDDMWKVLLMLGIGVFINHKNIRYTEIMKKMADEQKLYLIIATSDYIYGTNYQFCHCYLSKDLDLTQEKIIQAMGRVGRNNVQQDYTIRFRDDKQILKLFTEETDKPEIINMNILFNSSKVSFVNGEYRTLA
jgi:hypothetical protein